ncbi:MAG: hypothetical protein WCF84_14090 [Anaerolineae bacterium]
MSLDTVCRLSHLQAAESRLRGEIHQVEVLAERQKQRLGVLESEAEQNEHKVTALDKQVKANQAQLHDVTDAIAQLDVQQELYERIAAENEARIQQHEQWLTSVDQHLAENRAAIAQAHQHIDVLQQEARQARHRIEQNSKQISALHGSVKQINKYLAAERDRQEAERQAKRDDVDAQAHLASELKARVDPVRARFFGAYNEYVTALTTLDQAEVNRQKGNLEVAVAQFQQGQSLLMQVARTIDEREAAFESKRAQCQALLGQLEAELKLLDTAELCEWYPAEVEQLHKRYQALESKFKGKQYEGAGEQVEIRMAIEQLVTQGMQIYQDIRQLDSRFMETIARDEERLARARDIISVLNRVWDQAVPYELSNMTADLKSSLKLATTRPHPSPNVTVYLELDGTVQFSWGGYEGMKCVEDVKRFEQTMREQQQVAIDILSTQQHPDAPNPYQGGGGGIPTISLPKPTKESQGPVEQYR